MRGVGLGLMMLAAVGLGCDGGGEDDAGDVAPEVTDVVADVADARPDVADARPDVADARPDVADAGPDSVDVSPDVADAGPDSVDVAPDSEDVAPDVADAGPDSVDVAPDVADVVPDAEDVAPDVADVVPDAEDVAPDSVDVVPDAEDVAPDSVDVVPDAEDVVPDAEDATPDADAEVSPPAPLLDEDYAADPDPALQNPERGMYYTWVQPDEAHSLVADWLFLGAVCNVDLSWDGYDSTMTSPVLKAYADGLVARRAAGLKVLFRPRYDAVSDDTPNPCGLFEADSVARMNNHVAAIAAMLGEFKDVIAFVEAGYLGRWGEWNTSGYTAAESPVLADGTARRAFIAGVFAAYAAAGLDRFVGLRRPVFAQEILDQAATADAPVALYNDCFMTNDSDMGTYSNFEEVNGSNFPSEADAKDWAMTLTATAPFGGETCPLDTGTPRWADCKQMVGHPTDPSYASEPGSLHMSYLHGGWAPDAKSTWVDGGCYDEIRRRLGYRFEVTGVVYPAEIAPGSEISVEVRVLNSGWARLHNPRTARLVLVGGEQSWSVGGPHPGATELLATATAHDAAALWEPGEVSTFEVSFVAPPAGNYALHLGLPDTDAPELVDYAVRIASTRDAAPLFDPLTGLNDLGITLQIGPP